MLMFGEMTARVPGVSPISRSASPESPVVPTTIAFPRPPQS